MDVAEFIAIQIDDFSSHELVSIYFTNNDYCYFTDPLLFKISFPILYAAIHNQQFDIAKLLVLKGADIEQLDTVNIIIT
jgi:hypothetical protein